MAELKFAVLLEIIELWPPTSELGVVDRNCEFGLGVLGPFGKFDPKVPKPSEELVAW